MQAEYYSKILYPLQDKVIPALKGSPFYLTGGTALSRGYYNHRYSDDLDYFVNYHPEFIKISELQVEKIKSVFRDIIIAVRDRHFYRIFVGEEKLKIELINDVPSHIGKLVEHPVIGLIDSRENILANKITAIADRALPKDLADIYFLLKDGLSIKEALISADSKAAGIAPLLIAKIFAEFDYTLLDTEIKWASPVPSETIRRYMNALSLAIVEGSL